MRISDLSSDVCSSDLFVDLALAVLALNHQRRLGQSALHPLHRRHDHRRVQAVADLLAIIEPRPAQQAPEEGRSEEHTSELQALMRISYAVFCLEKKTSQ